MHTIIYGLCDSGEPGVIRYVGKTYALPQKRLAAHLDRSRRESTHKATWIKSVLAEGRKIEVTEIAFAATNDEANRLERHYEKGVKLPPRSQEYRETMSRAQHGLPRPWLYRPFSPERKARISAALRGNPKLRTMTKKGAA